MDLYALIDHLQRLKKSHGGDAEVFIGDRKIPHQGWTVGGFEIQDVVDQENYDHVRTQITINPLRV